MKGWMVVFLAMVLAAGEGCGTRSVPVSADAGNVEAQRTPEVDITGIYTPEYQPKSAVQITREGEVYTVRWEHPFGVWVGVGLRDGNQLSVGWQRVDGHDLGVSIYQIEQGGQGPKLVSRFAGYRDNKVQQETLRFLKKLD
jgi:hypothetical protein